MRHRTQQVKCASAVLRAHSSRDNSDFIYHNKMNELRERTGI